MRRRRIPRPCLITLLLLTGLLQAARAAPDMAPQLTGAGTPRSPEAALEITVSATLDDHDLEMLAVELDGIDNTAVTQTTRGEQHITLRLLPAQPLSPGTHELRLLTFSDEGTRGNNHRR